MDWSREVLDGCYLYYDEEDIEEMSGYEMEKRKTHVPKLSKKLKKNAR